MYPLPVGVDNSVLGDLGNYLYSPSTFPSNKLEDVLAFKQLIKFDHQGYIKLGLALSGAGIESQQCGSLKFELVRKEMGTAWRLWPCIATSDLVNKKKCLKSIMQDKNGVDSDNFLVTTIHSKYYLMTDYRYIRRFKSQREKIINICRIMQEALTPSEFLKLYNE